MCVYVSKCLCRCACPFVPLWPSRLRALLCHSACSSLRHFSQAPASFQLSALSSSECVPNVSLSLFLRVYVCVCTCVCVYVCVCVCVCVCLFVCPIPLLSGLTLPSIASENASSARTFGGLLVCYLVLPVFRPFVFASAQACKDLP